MGSYFPALPYKVRAGKLQSPALDAAAPWWDEGVGGDSEADLRYHFDDL